MRTPNEQIDGHDTDLSAADNLIESLRQQLAAALAACKVKDEALEYISQNYDESDYDWQVALNALATTADLSGLILCRAEPVGWCGTSGVGEIIVSKSKVWNFLTTPLYRAWEPKK